MSAFAYSENESGLKTEVYEEEDSIIATTTDYDNELVATTVYDANEGTVKSTYKNLATNEVISSRELDIVSSVPPISTNGPDIEKSTDLNFKYIIRQANEWYLQRPKFKSEGTGAYYFCTTRNNSNRNELANFKTAVDDLAEKEVILRNATSNFTANIFTTSLLTLAMAGFGALFAPLAISNALALSGLEGEKAEAGEAVANAGNECYYAIEEVYYCTDNMYFDW